MVIQVGQPERAGVVDRPVPGEWRQQPERLQRRPDVHCQFDRAGDACVGADDGAGWPIVMGVGGRETTIE